MPTKKTGQKKKKEKQRELQKQIQNPNKHIEDLKAAPANTEIICDECGRRQKSRLFCYFCNQVQRPRCAQCGKIKCLQGTGDCMIPHANRHAIGMAMLGAICDFCEAPICHSRKCLQTHACTCPLRDGDESARCIECERNIWEHGGRAFRCATCRQWLCEDDQFEHQASCQTLEGETTKCISCNRVGTYTCLRCKICVCTQHAKKKVSQQKNDAFICKKCGYDLAECSQMSMSVRRHDYGRHGRQDSSDDDGYAGFGNAGYRSSGDDDDDDDDEDYMIGSSSSD